MKQKILKQIKSRLEKDKEELETELAKMAKKQGDGDYKPKFPDYGDEPDDNILEIENFAENIEIEQKLEELLRQTNKALENIGKGTYGYCKKCNKQIDPERLKAYPIATTCLNCK
jgi:DnaK suppressor protein